MIEDFGVGQGSEGGREAAVAFWTGIVGRFFPPDSSRLLKLINPFLINRIRILSLAVYNFANVDLSC